jgi:hypothetical protein
MIFREISGLQPDTHFEKNESEEALLKIGPILQDQQQQRLHR